MTPPADNGLHPAACRMLDFTLHRPKTAVFLAALLAVALIPGISRLRSDFSYRIWFREGGPELTRFDAFERRFGNDESIVIAVHSPSGIFDPDSARLLLDLTKELWQVPEVIRVDGLANFNWVHSEDDDIIVEPLLPDDRELTPHLLAARRAAALKHESLPGYLISRDAKTSLIFAHLKPSFEGSPDYAKIMHGTRAVLAKYQGRGDHVFHLTGAAAISQAFEESSQTDMKRLIPIVIGVTVALLLLVFRGAGGILAALGIVGLTSAMTMGVAGWTGIPFTTMTSIIPQILIAIGIADSVHILMTFFRARSAGMARADAARLSLTKNFVPTALTSISTAIGFFSFATSELVPLAQLGILSGAGTLLAWVLTYLLVGPLMVLIPIKARLAPAPRQDQVGPWAQTSARRLYRFRRSILTAFGAAAAASAVLAAGNVVNSDTFKYFASHYWLTVANRFVEDNVGAAMGPDILIDSGTAEGIKDPAFLKKVEAYEKWIAKKPFVTKTISIIDILKQVNRSLHGEKPEYYVPPRTKEAVAQELFLYTMNLPQGMDLNDRVTIGSDALRLTALWTLHDSETTLRTIDEFKEEAARRGLKTEFTGKTVLWQGMNPMIVRSFFVSVSLALILVTLLLMAAFRSPRMGALALLPNVIPLLFGGAFLRLWGQPLDIGTVLVTSVSLGIAVDDTIHFLAAFNRLIRQGFSRREAVARVMTHTAPALIVTSLILVGAFGAYVFGTFIPNVNFGIMVAMVLMAALFTDLIFLPALLMAVPFRLTPAKRGLRSPKPAAAEKPSGNVRL